MNYAPAVKIMLVDDDDGHADLVKLNLERSGLANDIVHFSNGRRAIDFLKSCAPGEEEKYLMLLDLNMPGMDGHQVLRCMKQSEHTRNIPIIVLTTAGDEEEVARCYAMRCNFYMQKPIEYEAFCDAVQELGLFIRKAKIPGSSMAVAQEGRT